MAVHIKANRRSDGSADLNIQRDSSGFHFQLGIEGTAKLIGDLLGDRTYPGFSEDELELIIDALETEISEACTEEPEEPAASSEAQVNAAHLKIKVMTRLRTAYAEEEGEVFEVFADAILAMPEIKGALERDAEVAQIVSEAVEKPETPLLAWQSNSALFVRIYEVHRKAV